MARIRYYTRFLISDHLNVYIPQTTFDGGTLQLTTHRIIWDDEDQEVCVLLMQLDFSRSRV